MRPNRVYWLGAHFSVVGVVLFLIIQLSTDSWRVEATCNPDSAVSGWIHATAGSHAIDVFVTYHVPGAGEWRVVPGSHQTLHVDGRGPHAFGPLNVSATPLEANSIRVEIEVSNDPTNEKSDSFKPCGEGSPSPTETSPPATLTTIPSPVATQSTPGATPSPVTSVRPSATSTSQPAPTATNRPNRVLPTSEVRGTSIAAPPTRAEENPVLGPPSSGSGGLLAQHRTSLTVLAIGFIAVGFLLITGRGIADARR